MTDAWNHSVVTYTNRSTVWAEVQYKRGTEKNVGQQRVNVDQVHFVGATAGLRTVEPCVVRRRRIRHPLRGIIRKEAVRVITTKTTTMSRSDVQFYGVEALEKR